MNSLFVYRSFLSMFFNVFSYICICLFLFLFCFHLNVTLTICVNFLVSVICFVSFLSVFLFLNSTFLSLILTNMRSNSLFLLFTFLCIFVFNIQCSKCWSLTVKYFLSALVFLSVQKFVCFCVLVLSFPICLCVLAWSLSKTNLSTFCHFFSFIFLQTLFVLCHSVKKSFKRYKTFQKMFRSNFIFTYFTAAISGHSQYTVTVLMVFFLADDFLIASVCLSSCLFLFLLIATSTNMLYTQYTTWHLISCISRHS